MTAPLFDPVVCAREVEEAARAGGWEIRHLAAMPSGPRPWLQRKAKSGAGAPVLYLSAGIHGDEIAGPVAVLEMLRQPGFFDAFNTTIFPLLNPEGLVRNVRLNLEGVDLNRDYKNSKSVEIASHIEALRTLGPIDAAVMLHEDYEGIGAYLYELNERLTESLGAEMIAAMGRHVPIDLRPEIEGVIARGGVINRKDLVALFGPIEERPEWPEALYLTEHHTRVAVTTESPMPFPLQQRVAAQVEAVRVMMEVLLRGKAEGND